MHFVYHPHHEPIIVSAEEYPAYLADGWYDSPAKFSAKGLAPKAEPVAKEEPVVEAVVEEKKEELQIVPKKKKSKGLKVQL